MHSEIPLWASWRHISSSSRFQPFLQVTSLEKVFFFSKNGSLKKQFFVSLSSQNPHIQADLCSFEGKVRKPHVSSPPVGNKYYSCRGHIGRLLYCTVKSIYFCLFCKMHLTFSPFISYPQDNIRLCGGGHPNCILKSDNYHFKIFLSDLRSPHWITSTSRTT